MNGRKSVIAKLLNVENNDIIFKCDDEQLNLNFLDLDLCRLKPNFDELMRGNK